MILTLEVLYALKPLVKSERGATLVEYGILVALIAVVSIGVIATVGLDVLAVFTGTLPWVAACTDSSERTLACTGVT